MTIYKTSRKKSDCCSQASKQAESLIRDSHLYHFVGGSFVGGSHPKEKEQYFLESCLYNKKISPDTLSVRHFYADALFIHGAGMKNILRLGKVH